MQDKSSIDIEKFGIPFFQYNQIFILHGNEEFDDWYERSIAEIYIIQCLEDLKAGIVLEADALGYTVTSVKEIRLTNGTFKLILTCDGLLEKNMEYTLNLTPVKSARDVLQGAS